MVLKALNRAIKEKDTDAIASVLWDHADDVSASGGNPFHKLRSTLTGRCTPKMSVKVHKEDGEICDVTVTRKVKGKSGTGGRTGAVLTSAEAYTKLVDLLSKRPATFIDALAKCDVDSLRKAVLAAKRSIK